MEPESKSEWRSNMLNKLLGAAAMAAAAYAFVPAHAAGFGCSGDDQAKAQGQVAGMADGPAKFAAQAEIARAQSAYLAGHMNQCAVHLANAMSASAAAPSYSETYAQGPYPGPYAQAPYRRGPYAAAPYPGPGQYDEDAGPYAQEPYAGPYPQQSPYGNGEEPY
jgi:hypothetical protein